MSKKHLSNPEFSYLLHQLNMTSHNLSAYLAYKGHLLKKLKAGMPNNMYQMMLKNRELSEEQANQFISLYETRKTNEDTPTMIYIEKEFNDIEAYSLPYNIDSDFLEEIESHYNQAKMEEDDEHKPCD